MYTYVEGGRPTVEKEARPVVVVVVKRIQVSYVPRLLGTSSLNGIYRKE